MKRKTAPAITEDKQKSARKIMDEVTRLEAIKSVSKLLQGAHADHP